MTTPESGPSVPRRGGPIRAGLGRLILRLVGWRIDNALPDLPKFVVTAGPHSSNWDFIVAIGFVFAVYLDVHFLAKAEVFRGPLGWVMRWLGGIPVDRSRPQGMVEDAAAMFAKHDRFVLAIAPEGTRKPVEKWKSGFYRIALAAGVPIVPGYFDNGRKAIGFGPVMYPSGDAEADIAALRAFYAPIKRRR